MRSKAIFVLAILYAVAMANIATAITVRSIDIDFVTIGNAGNVGDARIMIGGAYGWGSVNYNYRIGKYEVTNAQWNAFTSSAGTPTNDGYYNGVAHYTGNQQPANNISWYETLQFCNYLTSGDKSKGAYRFSGNNTNPGNFLGINREAAKATYGTVYALPTVNEWHKAAYFKPDGSGYSLYSNGLDTIPVADNGWNYNNGSYYEPWNAGSGEQEQNGTFDMTGNVWEWNETMIGYNNYYGPSYGLRGGSFRSSGYYITSSFINSYHPQDEDSDFGFRIVSIPEPATLLLIGLGGLILRRKW